MWRLDLIDVHSPGANAKLHTRLWLRRVKHEGRMVVQYTWVTIG